MPPPIRGGGIITVSSATPSLIALPSAPAELDVDNETRLIQDRRRLTGLKFIINL